MGMISTALGDAGKRMFQPMTMLTGGANLAVTGTKAIRESQKPKVQAPIPMPQASRAPDRGALGAGLAAMQGGPMAGTSSTFLTGPAGVKGVNVGRALLGE